jgi:hypothetical protein
VRENVFVFVNKILFVGWVWESMFVCVYMMNILFIKKICLFVSGGEGLYIYIYMYICLCVYIYILVGVCVFIYLYVWVFIFAYYYY